MPYDLAFTETAAEDLERLIDSLPRVRQEPAIDAIEQICLAFAAKPLHQKGRHHPVPTFPLQFKIDKVEYHWVATYRLTIDEKSLEITHIFRVPL